MNTHDEDFMRRAFDAATRTKRDGGNEPIGAVIVRDGKILAIGANEVTTSCDPTAHAEMVAIRQATSNLKSSDLRGATLYSTLQPCGMCTMAMIWSKVSRIVYGAGRDDVHQMYFEDRHMDTLDYINDAYRDDISLEGGVLKPECAGLYNPPEADVPVEEQGNL
ncbi:MAG: nucleoside deaminase [Beijerinckiaceae bacterium]|nr:nucleoside deaminase [Beijerinckiaceae bacterium]